MKTLKEHTILYDATCPMCRLYTGAFVRTGMLDARGRAPYQGLQEGSCPGLDRARAVNEIALVNQRTGEVTYGVASLFRILGNAWPWLGPLFRFGPFAWLAAKAYSFISYNRRVIMPARADVTDTPPAFHRGWRAAWIGFAWLLTALILYRYSHRMIGIVPPSNMYREFAVCGGQILWQGALIRILHPERSWDYLGNMMTVSFAGGLLLAIFAGLFDVAGMHDPRVATLAFLLVAGAMLLEHVRRCGLLGLSLAMSASWILYRLLLLAFILN
ncbi:DUF393 domain-containing protein [Flaviaesturariibacter flavus]|uniref:DUF393 domain-containing protein n=1 Tax=Flaviaesturariibacter flavus TaxID=2502780 RepID=A0A4R1BNT7_9BACT|nr:DCC1-like thiol-disulfide oxidoreductase family protein [Flaviaesturariibacter flavus]TCJ19017.1 DUF393 domain-containing protein [Flaviaesturariibacter flavus]